MNDFFNKDVFKHEFKLWGPLRSGTNYLGRLMELNFENIVVHHNKGGWKHGPPQDLLFNNHLLIIKNPFAWIDSMKRYSMMPVMEIPWYCDQWNRHARELFSFSWREDALLIKYERLIQFQQAQLEDIEATFNLTRKHDAFLDEPQRMLRGGDEMKGEKALSTQKMNTSYYINRIYMVGFTPSEIKLVQAHIDFYLIRQLNYLYEYEALPF